ncbi:MAG TPA: hypothetical protein PKE39_04275 [Ignavibacteria bacterium]|nr:hypothetical protein [Ignavibacteria bacterium]
MAKNTNEIKVNIGKATKAIEAEVEKHLRTFLEKVRTDADAEIRKGKAYASLEMLKSLRYQVTKEIGKIIGVVGTGANVPYAIYRHEGTKPHFPPIEPLQRWVLLKGLTSNREGTKGGVRLAAIRNTVIRGSGVKRRRAMDRWAESKGIALAIARKIARKGTTGLPFLRTALNLNRGFLMAEMAKMKV